MAPSDPRSISVMSIIGVINFINDIVYLQR